MTEDHLLGWLAAGLTLLTFSMRSMIALRTAALAANLCFIAYGAQGALYPVLALHLLLLPCNLLRLRQLCRRRLETEEGRRAAPRPTSSGWPLTSGRLPCSTSPRPDAAAPTARR